MMRWHQSTERGKQRQGNWIQCICTSVLVLYTKWNNCKQGNYKELKRKSVNKKSEMEKEREREHSYKTGSVGPTQIRTRRSNRKKLFFADSHDLLQKSRNIANKFFNQKYTLNCSKSRSENRNRMFLISIERRKKPIRIIIKANWFVQLHACMHFISYFAKPDSHWKCAIRIQINQCMM